MPSPYATQRPTTTRASSRTIRSTSRARRDLPIRGPTIVTSRARRVSHRAVERTTELAELERRPTNGVAIARANAGTSGRKPTNLHAIERPALALRLDWPRGLDDDRIPNEAIRRLADEDLARSRRLLEPRCDVHRVAGRELWSEAASADDHLARVDAGTRRDANAVLTLELVVDPSSPSRISSAARTARSASSSCTAGTPKTATIASPMNFSTVPPCRSSVACTASNTATSHAAATPDRAARRAPSIRRRP